MVSKYVSTLYNKGVSLRRKVSFFLMEDDSKKMSGENIRVRHPSSNWMSVDRNKNCEKQLVHGLLK